MRYFAFVLCLLTGMALTSCSSDNSLPFDLPAGGGAEAIASLDGDGQPTATALPSGLEVPPEPDLATFDTVYAKQFEVQEFDYSKRFDFVFLTATDKQPDVTYVTRLYMFPNHLKNVILVYEDGHIGYVY